jgi:hypothetical protein
MAQEQVGIVQQLSLDWWAVIVALGLAALIRVGIIPSVPW